MALPTKYLADAHMAKVLVQELQSRGLDVLHCEEVGLAEVDDLSLLAYAAEHERVLLTCDRGFRQWGFIRLAEGLNHAGILLFDQLEHCQNIGRIVKIVLDFHALVISESDTLNRFYEGKALE